MLPPTVPVRVSPDWANSSQSPNNILIACDPIISTLYISAIELLANGIFSSILNFTSSFPHLSGVNLI